MMKKIVLAAAMAAATLATVPASAATYVEAGGWTPREILFGKQYNGNVTAIRVDGGGLERNTYPMQAVYPTGNSLALAQSMVTEDPSLSAALEVRGIATHNVLWVQTAFNGGKIVYYR
ncbi:hypothetical protein GVN24_06465 [Rhizobium sp. CRIBSB]|uniref:Uncharacterized protein n=1 Tax=Peteryoungia aggregata LMG 23059 TaxID=1368425 RepID=A0ABU0G495_9HYPH|nr:hypothetical protein [Peteryoungia aggregata]MDQ0420154.1 hypothetical protein [Peteryoungia aggregata LMG 23059]NBB47910.1 hypothetical protein [Rhizobium sp. CRIBSB]